MQGIGKHSLIHLLVYSHLFLFISETLQVVAPKSHKTKVLDDDFILPVSLILENKGYVFKYITLNMSINVTCMG